jgi:hypothetical protein
VVYTISQRLPRQPRSHPRFFPFQLPVYSAPQATPQTREKQNRTTSKRSEQKLSFTDLPVSNPSSSWTSGSHSGLISIGPHSLFLSASGPLRSSPTQPAIIIETGLGSNSSRWVAVQRLVSQFARVYSYDRAGYGKSRAPDPSAPLPASAYPPTTKRRCQELTELLKEARVHPPWVLVGQSFGGVLIREFLLMHEGYGYCG